MHIDALTWKDAITMGVALIGAVLGVMNTWNAMNQQRVRVRVTPHFVASMDGRPIGVSIEAINLSAFALTIKEIGFMGGSGRVPVLSAQFPEGAALPWRLAPRESASAMVGPRDVGIPPFDLAMLMCELRADGRSRATALPAANLAK